MIEVKLRFKQATLNYEDICNPSENDTIHKEYIDKEGTIQELFEKVGEIALLADITHYYKIPRDYYRNNKILPYLLTTGNLIKWNVPYDKATIEEFIYTHNINNREIVAIYGIPQASGLEVYIDPEFMWNWLLNWDNILKVYGTYSLLKDLKKWLAFVRIKKREMKKATISKIQPDALLAYLTSKDNWDAKRLSVNIDINEKTSEELLVFTGYKFNKNTCMYEKTYIVDRVYRYIDDLYYNDNLLL